MIFTGFRIIDESNDFFGSVIIENGIIKEITAGENNIPGADIVVDGRAFGPSAVLMPAFIDLHAHFRDSVFSEKGTSLSAKVTLPSEVSFPAKVSLPAEVLESASLAAVAGGYGTVICMANTRPAIDTIDKARALKTRSDALGLIDLYPVLSLTANMEGRELSGIQTLPSVNSGAGFRLPLMLSEDGKDVADDSLFLAAMGEAKRLGIPVSCHCDLGGENNAVRRAIELGKKAGCHIHIAHVSTGEAAETIRHAKKNLSPNSGFILTCEATPHHIGAAEEDAQRMGAESFGRVNPPLRTEADRQAVIAAIRDKTIDAIATDHAPHSGEDKAAGAPGFSGLETAFAVCSNLVTDTQQLSTLMSANPARILGFRDRGRIEAGMRADLVIVDMETMWKVSPGQFKSRGKCSPFTGRELRGKIIMTINAGRIVFTGDKNV